MMTERYAALEREETSRAIGQDSSAMIRTSISISMSMSISISAIDQDLCVTVGGRRGESTKAFSIVARGSLSVSGVWVLM